MSAQNQERIRREVEEIGALPTLPSVPMQVLQLVTDAKTSIEDISEIVERDPPLTANILKVANSAYYGIPQKVGSLKLAMTLLGLNELINIVTSISVVRMFPVRSDKDSCDRMKFWRHSFGCATAARMLANDLDFDFESEGIDFVAGLLHDIGKLIIDQHFHAEQKRISETRAKEDLTQLEAEAAVLGADHALLGSWLAQKWQMPALLVESITYHHRPLDVLALAEASRNPALTAVVHLADILAHEPDLDFAESHESSQSFSENRAWKIILAERPDLDMETIELFIAKHEEYQETVNELVEAMMSS